MVNFRKDSGQPHQASGAIPRSVSSGFYGRARNKAADYMQSKDKLTGLIDKASVKATGKQGRLADVWQSLLSFLRLVRAYANGTYRDVSPKALLMIVASIIYFVSPIDLIPDFIIGLGFIDDATVLAWTIRACAADLAAFMAWEKTHKAPAPKTA